MEQSTFAACGSKIAVASAGGLSCSDGARQQIPLIESHPTDPIHNEKINESPDWEPSIGQPALLHTTGLTPTIVTVTTLPTTQAGVYTVTLQPRKGGRGRAVKTILTTRASLTNPIDTNPEPGERLGNSKLQQE